MNICFQKSVCFIAPRKTLDANHEYEATRQSQAFALRRKSIFVRDVSCIRNSKIDFVFSDQIIPEFHPQNIRNYFEFFGKVQLF